MIAWIDIETTGLDPEMDGILEVACVLTDNQLVELEHRHEVVRWPPKILESLRVRADPFVQKMHDENGLWAECSCPGAAVHSGALVAQRFVDWLKAQDAVRLEMGGSSVHFDRAFLRSRMRDLHDVFAHRDIDVSVLRGLASRWNPGVFAARPKGDSTASPAYRALPDIRASIESLRYYRDHFLVCALGQ